MTLSFLHPYLLLFLLALPVLAWLKGQRGQQAAFLYSSAQLVRSVGAQNRWSAGRFLASLRWLVLAAFIVALARPQIGEGEAKISASGIDIVVCVDLSRSMEAEDFKDDNGGNVNRLALAKQVLKKFIENRPSDRIGLVAFAGRAYIAAPLTLDHDFLLANLERLNFGGIEEGTAIGSGLVAAVNRLRDIKSKSKIVVLLTDGQNNMGKVPPLTAAEVAQKLKIKVYTVGVGSRGMAPWPFVNAFGQKQYRMMPVDIDEETLREVSDKTGGRYYRADTSETLKHIYAEIDRLEKTVVEMNKFQRYREAMHWPILIGLGLLLLEIVLSHTLFRKLP
jgi:Ca-activated chloride channel family protein